MDSILVHNTYHRFLDNTSGKLKSSVSVGNTNIRINSGHGYNRAHAGGDITINIDGYRLTYRANKLNDGTIRVATYFLGN